MKWDQQWGSVAQAIWSCCVEDSVELVIVTGRSDVEDTSVLCWSERNPHQTAQEVTEKIQRDHENQALQGTNTIMSLLCIKSSSKTTWTQVSFKHHQSEGPEVTAGHWWMWSSIIPASMNNIYDCVIHCRGKPTARFKCSELFQRILNIYTLFH